MNPIEESLRRALEGGDPSDPVFRQSIYAASERAMERMIEGRGLDEERANTERARLGEVMERVEGEYSAYYQSTAGYGADGDARPEEGVESWHAEPEAWEEPGHRPGDEGSGPSEGTTPPSGPARAPASFSTPVATPSAEPEGEIWTPGAGRTPERGARRSGPARKIVVVIAALLLLAVLAYGVMLLLAPAGTEAPAPQTTGQAPEQVPGPIVPDAPQEPQEELAWINVFSGGDLEQISTPDGGRVESVAEAERAVVRLSGPEGAEGEILINIGPGLVGELAGSDVRIEIVAGSPDDSLREFSVRCVFGEASICDRQRFATAMGEEAFVFDVSVPADVSTPANLAIGPGLSPEGRDLDLYSIRMRVL